MAKPATPSTSVRSPWGRGRAAESPGEPFHVSEADAQATTPNVNSARHWDFGRPDESKLPERPSTSGGPSSSRFTREKRETKDDLYFDPLKVHGIEKGTAVYNFPLPRTPANPAIASTKSPSIIKDSPESVEEAIPTAMSFQPAEIGMALGSPTHQPTTWNPHGQSNTQTKVYGGRFTMSPSPDMESSVEGLASVPVPSKHKPSKWKVFGGLFGATRKTATSPAFYQVQGDLGNQATVEADHARVDGRKTSLEKGQKSRGRTKTASEKKSKDRRPDPTRAQTAPLDFEFHSKSGRADNNTPEILIDGGLVIQHQTQMLSSTGARGGLMLNVEIPTTQLERYSVMFGSVLERPASSATSSSLLARRQATLDRLKTVNEALALKEQELEERAKLTRPRRATSPQPSKSPAFSLFPSTPSRLTVRDLPVSPLQRSNTSPAALSPSRPSFSHDLTSEMRTSLRGPAPHIPVDPRPRNHTATRNKLEPRAPIKPVPPAHVTVARDLVPLSPVSDVEEEDEQHKRVHGSVKIKLEEPQWQMMNTTHPNPTSASSTSSHSDGHSSSTSASSAASNSDPQAAFSIHGKPVIQIQPPPSARRKRSATNSSTSRPRPEEVSNTVFGAQNSSKIMTQAAYDAEREVRLKKEATLSIARQISVSHQRDTEEREERLKSAANVSIARQISVSRQQRQLLIPIKRSAGLSPKASPQSGSSSPLGRVASPLEVVSGRLVQPSTKPSTPTLVLVGEDNECMWAGATMTSRSGSPAFTPGMGEIRVGLSVNATEVLNHRKSERVVLESV